MVRRNREGWNCFATVDPTELKTGDIGQIGPYKFAGGVYVQATLDLAADWKRLLHRLYCYQLSSPNRGLEYKHWIIPDLGPRIEMFEIDPEQDLLVLLETRFEVPGDEMFRLHLRAMSTNKIHPRAATGHLDILLQHQPDTFESNCPFLEISGCLLAALLKSRTGSHPSYLVIWNWTTGVELLVGDHM